MLNLKEKRGREGKRSTKAKPPWTVNIYLKKKKRTGGKNKSSPGMGTSRRWVGTRKGEMRVNMVNIFCIHI
jgi:hypothetical protein